MKAKGIVISIAVFLVLALGVVMLLKGPKAEKVARKEAKPVSAAAEAKKELPKKTFAKDMGGLTVKMTDVKAQPKMHRVRAFRATGPNSGVFTVMFVTNRMEELAPGIYDIEIDTMPPMIYKNMKVVKEKETIEDIGCPMGSLNVKALSSQKKDARYPVRLHYPNSAAIVAAGQTNRALDVVAGTYDIEIGTLPSQMKKNVSIEAGKEVPIDLGITTGTIMVKAADENGASAKLQVRVKGIEKGQFVAAGTTGRSVEVLAGKYDLDILSKPVQTKKGVEIKAGEEVVVNIAVQAQPKRTPAPAPVPAAPKPQAKPATVKQ